MNCVAHQAPPSIGFSGQDYWNGLPCPPPGDLPNPRIELRSPILQADSLPSEPAKKPKLMSIISQTHTHTHTQLEQKHPGQKKNQPFRGTILISQIRSLAFSSPLELLVSSHFPILSWSKERCFSPRGEECQANTLPALGILNE